MALSRFLPAPTQNEPEREEKANFGQEFVPSGRDPPRYGSRQGWIPRIPQDFGDGGAFPEIHLAQYPLEMGRKRKISKALAVQVDAGGKIKWEAMARGGQGKARGISSKSSELMPGEGLSAEDPQRPSQEEIKNITERTRAALEGLSSQKSGPARYFRFTPSPQGAEPNPGVKQRLLRVVELQKDPVEPPRFRSHGKPPRAPPGPPGPVLSSPGRAGMGKEQREWKIPPCIPGWKNPKGFTVPLEKRCGLGGAGEHGGVINCVNFVNYRDFSRLAEALGIAQRKAREALELRARLETELARREKEKKEEKLRETARRAREGRAGIKIRLGKEKKEEKLRETARGAREGRAGIRTRLGNEDGVGEETRVGRDRSGGAADKGWKMEGDKSRDKSREISVTDKGWRMEGDKSGDKSGEISVTDKGWRMEIDKSGDKSRVITVTDKGWRIKSWRFGAAPGVPNSDFGTSEGPGRLEEDPFGLEKFLEAAKNHRGSEGPQEGERKRRRKE